MDSTAGSTKPVGASVPCGVTAIEAATMLVPAVLENWHVAPLETPRPQIADRPGMTHILTHNCKAWWYTNDTTLRDDLICHSCGKK